MVAFWLIFDLFSIAFSFLFFCLFSFPFSILARDSEGSFSRCDVHNVNAGVWDFLSSPIVL